MGSRRPLLISPSHGVHRRAANALALVGVLAAVVILEAPLCPLAHFAHIPCPGCGLTRATLALLRGNFSAAMAFHPLAPIVAPLVGTAILLHTGSYVRGGTLLSLRGKIARFADALLLTVAMAMLGVWIARFFGAFGGPVPV